MRLLARPADDAVHRSDANAPGQKHGWPLRILMQGEASSGPADLKPHAIRSPHQGGLELRDAHPHGNHNRTPVVRRACERKRPRDICAPGGGICENKIGVLPGTKFVLATVGRKPERHGISRNSLPFHQLHLVYGHDLSLDTPFLRPDAKPPAISMPKRKRNVPAHVGSRSQQQNQPPRHKYGAHPQLVAPDAKSFGKQLRPRSQENVQSDNLDDSTEGPVRSRQPNVALPKFRWDFRTYLLAK